jgi:coiled-coil domain-containing protein 6
MLEAETIAKQTNPEQLRREMVELENTLEQEQEALVNKLWKRMDKLEAEKRSLQIRLDQPIESTHIIQQKIQNNAKGDDTHSNSTVMSQIVFSLF